MLEQQNLTIFIIVVNDRDDYQNTWLECFTNWFEAWERFHELLVEYDMTELFNLYYGSIDDTRLTNQNSFDVSNGDHHISFDTSIIKIT